VLTGDFITVISISLARNEIEAILPRLGGYCSISDVKFGFVNGLHISFSYLLANFFLNITTIDLWFGFARSVFQAKCLEGSKILITGVDDSSGNLKASRLI
jgi:hypothetical protein